MTLQGIQTHCSQLTSQNPKTVKSHLSLTLMQVKLVYWLDLWQTYHKRVYWVCDQWDRPQTSQLDTEKDSSTFSHEDWFWHWPLSNMMEIHCIIIKSDAKLLLVGEPFHLTCFVEIDLIYPRYWLSITFLSTGPGYCRSTSELSHSGRARRKYWKSLWYCLPDRPHFQPSHQEENLCRPKHI